MYNSENQKLAEKLHKPIVRKFKKCKVYSIFKGNILGADLSDRQLISKYIAGFQFLLCPINIFSKFACIVPLKNKKGITIINAFQKKLCKSERRKTNKIWVDKDNKFYQRLIKSWLQYNNIEIYSINNN